MPQADEEPEYKRLAGKSAVFMPPTKVSRKIPEAGPSIGQYEMSFHTIQTRLKKQKEKYTRKVILYL